MSRKRFTPEQIIGMPREAEVALSALLRNLSAGLKFNLSRAYQPFLIRRFPSEVPSHSFSLLPWLLKFLRPQTAHFVM